MMYPQDAPWLDVVLDAETYYSSRDYTLKKMDPPSYLLDPRFEMIGTSVKIEQQPTGWVDGPQVAEYIGDLKSWAAREKRPIRQISHNMTFDGALFSWHYGFVADQMVDTLALSRALLGYILRRHDLGSVARFLGLGDKGKTIVKVDGMRRADIIAAGLWNEYANYSVLDSDLCRGIYDRLFPILPWSEALIFDMVHRMAVIPRLQVDTAILTEHLAEVRAEKDQLLAGAGLDFSTPEAKAQSVMLLMSNDKLAEILTGMGITPPTKASPSDPNKEIWAFAKTDQEFQELAEHPDPAVQAIVAARLGHKSTLEESRCERMLNIARLNFPRYGTGLMPIALKPSGAHTHRLSGDWQLNFQNLPRPSLRRPKPKLRMSLTPRSGRRLCAADSRQIEARLAMTFCEQWDAVEEFEDGADSYSLMATSVFGYPVDKTMVGPRFCGKLLVLSGNYQTGWRKFRHTLAHSSREQIGTPIILSEIDARRYVATYRLRRNKLTAMWQHLHYVVIPAMTRPDTDFMLGPIRVMFEKIVLPNGMCLHYSQLHRDPVSMQWLFTYGGRIKKLYGGKLLENIIQALAKIVVMDAALLLAPMMELVDSWLALQSHDELVYDAPVEHADYVCQLLNWAMKLRPKWLVHCPVDADMGKPALSYADAKV